MSQMHSKVIPPDPDPPSTISQRKREASQRNGAMSQGPCTEDGKARSKFNALKHGLSAQSTLLPGEDADAFDHRRDAWTEALKPRDEFEEFYLAQAIDASWRMDRCRDADTAVLRKLVRKAVDADDSARADVVDDLIADLPASPRRAARHLRTTAGGCRCWPRRCARPTRRRRGPTSSTCCATCVRTRWRRSVG